MAIVTFSYLKSRDRSKMTVEVKLNKIISDYATNGITLTPDLARTEIETHIGKIKTWTLQNPGVTLNNIVIP